MDSLHVYAGASRREYREDQGLRRRKGRDLSDFTFGLYIFSGVHEDMETGIDTRRTGRTIRSGFQPTVHRYALAGDPDTCKARLQEYVDAGASMVFVSSACPEDYLDRNIEMIAKDVIPAFR